jgi:hypothetical protein
MNQVHDNIRQVTLTDRITLLFENKGTIAQNALLLDDVDNDNYVEFIMGSIYGSLVIYKFRNTQPVYRCDHLGTVCVSIDYSHFIHLFHLLITIFICRLPA